MGVCDAFKAEVAQIDGTSSLGKEVAKVHVSEPAIFAPTGTYVVKIADRAFSQASKPKVNAVSHSSPPFESCSLLSERK